MTPSGCCNRLGYDHLPTTFVGIDEMLLKEICPRGNNKVVIYISLYHDKCLLFMLEWY